VATSGLLPVVDALLLDPVRVMTPMVKRAEATRAPAAMIVRFFMVATPGCGRPGWSLCAGPE